MQQDDLFTSRPTTGQERRIDDELSFWSSQTHTRGPTPESRSPWALSAPFALGPPVSVTVPVRPASPTLIPTSPMILDSPHVPADVSPMPTDASPPRAPKLGSESSSFTPPQAPRAPTFDSPSRFTHTSNSYPSPIQAGFRTPVSKASSSRRSVSSSKVARALTFGDDDQAGFSPLSLDTRIARFSSPGGPQIEKKLSFRSLSSTGKRDGFGSSSQSQERESSDERDSSSRGHTSDKQNVLRSWAEEREDEFDGRPPAMMSTGLMSLQADDEGLLQVQRVPSSSTLGGRREQTDDIVEPTSTPAPAPVFGGRPTSPSPVRERLVPNPAPAPVGMQPLQGEYINMGEGLAGGPQRDVRGKKINVDKWKQADPLSGPEAATRDGKGKELGGFKKRFSASLLNLVGATNKQADHTGSSGNVKGSPMESADQSPGSRARRLFFGRKPSLLPQGRGPEVEQPPAVPERSSSYKNPSFLRNRAQRQSGPNKALPYSPSMPILSETLGQDSPTDARIIAWLSSTSLNLDGNVDAQNRQRRSQSQSAFGFPDDRMNWSAQRSRPVPAKLRPQTMHSGDVESVARAGIETPSLPSRASTPVAEDGQVGGKKPRSRSLARLSNLFRRSSSYKTEPLSSVTPPQKLDTGNAYQFPPIASRRQSDTSQASLRKSLKSPQDGEPLDGPGSRWQSRRTSGDWRKLLQNASAGTLRPEEAEHFASIVSGPSPSVPSLSRSSTPAFEASQNSTPAEDEQLRSFGQETPTLRSPLAQSFPLLGEVIEEEDHANMTATTIRAGSTQASIGVQTDPTACSHCHTSERPTPGRNLSGRRMSQTFEKPRHQRHSHRASASSTLLSEVTEMSTAADHDVRIRTILSSPVHAVPATPSRASLISPGLSDVSNPDITPGQTPMASASETRRLSLAFPMPPGYPRVTETA